MELTIFLSKLIKSNIIYKYNYNNYFYNLQLRFDSLFLEILFIYTNKDE